MLQADQILQNRYQLKQQLGDNAGRQTWLSQDLEKSELVVVKLLVFGGNVQWDDLKLFEREADVLKQLDHPRIPKYRDYFSIDDRSLWFGLVQEYIAGKSLKELLVEGKKFTEAQVKQISIDILQILQYLHELNPPVLHRDIKPSNLIWKDGQVYLVDFGAVQDKAAAEGRTFTVVGTYGYAPMEQFGGRAVPASDLYALGATLIHLLTGISPADLPQDDMKIEFGDRTSANPNFVRWIESLVEPSLKKRVSSAKQALEKLKLSNRNPQPPPQKRRKAANQIAIIKQPHDSKIHLERSDELMLITLPALGFKFSFSMGNIIAMYIGIMIIFSLASVLSNNPTSKAYLFVLGMIAGAAVFAVNNFKITRIRFDRDELVLTREFQGFIYLKKTTGISEIQYCHAVGINQSISLREGNMSISIGQSNDREYLIGDSRFTEMEAAWLAQEINAWLRRE